MSASMEERVYLSEATSLEHGIEGITYHSVAPVLVKRVQNVQCFQCGWHL